MYQVHLELVNQSVCDNLWNPSDDMEQLFDQELMICAGDVENGGRDSCQVGHYCVCQGLKETQKTKCETCISPVLTPFFLV